MEEKKGHVCPECGAPRGADNSPSCECGPRAADALRDVRTAEAAAAEDFDPLRIRPWVALEEGGTGSGAGTSASAGAGAGAATAADAEGEAETRPLPVVEPNPAGPPDAWEGAAPPTTVSPSATAVPPMTTVGPPPTTAVPPMTTVGPPTIMSPRAGEEAPRRSRRGRPAALLAASAAVVAVVAAAGMASGLFSYDTPTRDGAAPEQVRESVPDVPTRTPSPSPPTTAAPPSARPEPSRPSPSPSASASPSRSAAPTTAPPSPTPSRPVEPTHSAATMRATASAAPAPALRIGDQGPEVKELQLRLGQLLLYTGQADGVYGKQVEDAVRNYQWSRGITADEPGVYGEATRTHLEAETSQP